MSLNHSDTGVVIIKGRTVVGETLSVELILNEYYDLKNFSYIWYIDGVESKGIAGDYFTLDEASLGKKISVAVNISTSNAGLITLQSAQSSTVWATDPSLGLKFTSSLDFWNSKGNISVSKSFVENFLSIKIKYTDSTEFMYIPRHDLMWQSLQSSEFKIIPSKKSINEVGGQIQLLPDIKSSINLTDVLESLKLYLNKPVPNSSPCKFIAADYDGDGKVSLSDVLNLLKVYLGKPSSISPSWVFTTSDYISNNEGLIKSNSCAIPDINVDALITPDVSLIGILRGDVDGSWVGTTG